MGPTSTRVGTPVVVHEGVGTFVASARAWAVVDWGDGVAHVLLLDGVEGVDGGVVVGGSRGGCGDEGGGVEGVLAALAAGLAGLVGGGHGCVEGGEVAHHALVLLLLVGVDGLCMLAEVVEAGELLGAVAGKGAFAGVFPERDKVRSTATTGARRGTGYLMCLARCSLRLKTMRQSP